MPPISNTQSLFSNTQSPSENPWDMQPGEELLSEDGFPEKRTDVPKLFYHFLSLSITLFLITSYQLQIYPATMLYKITPDDKLVFNLHPGQRRALASTARFPVIVSGTQSGKTVFSPIRLLFEIQHRGRARSAITLPEDPANRKA